MTKIQTYFSDETQTVITAVGVTWQDDPPESLTASDWFDDATHGYVDIDDARYILFYDSLPAFLQVGMPEPVRPSE